MQAGKSDPHGLSMGRPVGGEGVQVHMCVHECMCMCTIVREHEGERTRRPWRDGSPVLGEQYLPSQLCLPAETARVYPE